jgi:hypothetical protein
VRPLLGDAARHAAGARRAGYPAGVTAKVVDLATLVEDDDDTSPEG